MGADGIESDAYLTKDKELVFFHDDTIQYNGKDYRLTQLTTEQIQSVDLGKGRRVPKVSDIFEHFKNRRNQLGELIRFSLDIKTIGMGDYLVKLAAKMGISDRVEITANDNYPNFWKKMKQWRAMNSEIQLVNSAHFNMIKLKQIFGRMYDQNWENYTHHGVKAINVKASYATPEVIEKIKQQNLQIYVWDCHTEDQMREFYKHKVHAIYSNYPDIAAKIRQEFMN
jgi:glycerophosphoryl diester phosphodiesterase